ncbi:MAG TPA: glycosyl transferase [Idiomarina sp.]|nr:glycosyl transferase [Idiomarina sp.]
MRDNPLVSVYIPTKNRVNLLKRALESVQRQTYPNIEIIVVNDGSTDATESVVKRAMASDSRIKLITFKESVGAPRARNEAITSASAEVVTGLDDDDYFLPHRIESLVRAYDPDYAFVCAGYYWSYGRVKRPLHNSLMLIDIDAQLHMNEASNQVLAEKSRIVDVGGFDEQMVSCQDWELWTRLLIKYGPALRVNDESYVIDASHDSLRITDNPERAKGFSQFEARFTKYMKPSHRRSIAFHGAVAAGQKLSLLSTIKLMTRPMWRRNIRYWLSCRFPTLTRKRLESLR